MPHVIRGVCHSEFTGSLKPKVLTHACVQNCLMLCKTLAVPSHRSFIPSLMQIGLNRVPQRQNSAFSLLSDGSFVPDINALAQGCSITPG